MTLDLTRPPFMTRAGTPMHFVGYDMDGDTVWQRPDTRITFRDKNGRALGEWSKRDNDNDIINVPPQPRTAYVAVYGDGTHVRVIGLVYSSRDLAELYARADKRVVRIAQIELPGEDHATQTSAA